MATLIGDVYGADSSPFHSRAPSSTTTSTTSGVTIATHQQQYSQHHQSSQHPQQPPSPSQSQERPMPTSSITTATSTTTTRHPASPPLSSSNSFSSPPGQATGSAAIVGQPAIHKDARIPTPPDSSSPSSPQQTRDGCVVQHMASNNEPSSSTISSSLPGIPASYVLPVPPLPQQVPDQRPQRTILIRDLNHIQSLTQADSSLSGGGSLGLGGTAPLQDVKFEISSMPIGDIIEMVAALLTKITTTNDHQHDALHRNASQQRQAQVHNESGADSHSGSGNGHSGTGSSPFSASVLAFHGKNVPAITILSYLSRIHKYCPTTYEVFLSLLVYFDRMTERVNDLVMKQQQEHEKLREKDKDKEDTEDVVMVDNDDSSDVDETDEGLADSDDSSSSSSEDEDEEGGATATTAAQAVPTSTAPVSTSAPAASSRSTPAPSASLDVAGPLSAATFFVVDSFNIHRLIIAGVTCASKFFSDVFYTNARYAKVGGLPLAELNHLELQFLILNDFRLAIPIEDLEAYATMLVEFYAREVVGNRPRPSSASTGSGGAGTGVPTAAAP